MCLFREFSELSLLCKTTYLCHSPKARDLRGMVCVYSKQNGHIYIHNVQYHPKISLDYFETKQLCFSGPVTSFFTSLHFSQNAPKYVDPSDHFVFDVLCSSNFCHLEPRCCYRGSPVRIWFFKTKLVDKYHRKIHRKLN